MSALEKTVFNRVATVLHFNKSVRSGIDVVEHIRKGLPFKIVEDVCAELGLSQQELSRSLGVNLRTLARRKLEKKLHSAESDRLYRLVRIFVLASEVCGNKEKAIQWLISPKTTLGGEIPLHLLDTEVGAKEIENLLGRIEHGVLA